MVLRVVNLKIQDYCLAVDKAVFQGDPVALVVAESQAVATDAAQLGS